MVERSGLPGGKLYRVVGVCTGERLGEAAPGMVVERSGLPDVGTLETVGYV